MPVTPLLRLTENGLYCEPGDFYVDPWRPVGFAVITHAHTDHTRWGCAHYLTARAGERLLQLRLGPGAVVESAGYGEPVVRHGVRISLHPAGHILGSAQVRLEHLGQVWVVSGDYKRYPDPTCAPFEPVRCHTFVTESTFGLPVYRWPDPAAVFAEVNAWWRSNREAGRASLLFGYALGKAQRLLAGLDLSVGPVYTHGAVEKMNAAYRDSGIPLPATLPVGSAPRGTDWGGALVLAPPSAHGTPWARKFGAASTGFASGWMRLRGTRRRRAVDRGFVLSDHADWPGLLDAVRETGAEQVWVTHGYAAVVARWLTEQGLDARAVPTRFEGEHDDEAEE
jgi:putative mRNA 3-end processing factor